MTLVAVLDFETTGLNEKESEITEVGCILWEVETDTVVDIYSSLVKIDSKVPERIKKLTSITDELLESYGRDKDTVFNKTNILLNQADYICAHNVSFEKKFYYEYFGNTLDKHWIDSKVDLPEEAYVYSTKLQYLSADNGFLNPFSHRAVFDCMTVVKLLSMFDFNQVLEKSFEPIVRIMALVDYDNRNLAKDAGFHWNSQEKVWQMEAKKSELKGKEFPFKVEII